MNGLLIFLKMEKSGEKNQSLMLRINELDVSDFFEGSFRNS